MTENSPNVTIIESDVQNKQLQIVLKGRAQFYAIAKADTLKLVRNVDTENNLKKEIQNAAEEGKFLDSATYAIDAQKNKQAREALAKGTEVTQIVEEEKKLAEVMRLEPSEDYSDLAKIATRKKMFTSPEQSRVPVPDSAKTHATLTIKPQDTPDSPSSLPDRVNGHDAGNPSINGMDNEQTSGGKDEAYILQIRPDFFKFQEYEYEANLAGVIKFNSEKKSREAYLNNPKWLISERYYERAQANTKKAIESVAQQKNWEIVAVDYLGGGAFTDAQLLFYRDKGSNDQDLHHIVMKLENRNILNRTKDNAMEEYRLNQLGFGAEHVAETEILTAQVDQKDYVVLLQEYLDPVIMRAGTPVKADANNILQFHKAMLRAHCLGIFPDLNSTPANYLETPTFGIASNGKIKILDLNGANIFSTTDMGILLQEPYFQNDQLPIEFNTDGKPTRLLPEFKDKIKTLRGPSGKSGFSGYDNRLSYKINYRSPESLEGVVCGTSYQGISPELNAGLQTVAIAIDQIRQVGKGISINETNIVRMGDKPRNIVKTSAELNQEERIRIFKEELPTVFQTTDDLRLIPDFLLKELTSISELPEADRSKRFHGVQSIAGFLLDSMNLGLQFRSNEFKLAFNGTSIAVQNSSQNESIMQYPELLKRFSSLLDAHIEYYKTEKKIQKPLDIFSVDDMRRAFERNFDLFNKFKVFKSAQKR